MRTVNHSLIPGTPPAADAAVAKHANLMGVTFLCRIGMPSSLRPTRTGVVVTGVAGQRCGIHDPRVAYFGRSVFVEAMSRRSKAGNLEPVREFLKSSNEGRFVRKSVAPNLLQPIPDGNRRLFGRPACDCAHACVATTCWRERRKLP